MPSVLACDNCGTYETEIMYFDTLEGRIYCEIKTEITVCKKGGCGIHSAFYLFRSAHKSVIL